MVSAIRVSTTTALAAMSAGAGRMSLGQKRVAEQRGAGNPGGAAQRPEREGERGQQAIGRGEGQRFRINAEDGRHRQHVLEPACQGERRDGAKTPADGDAAQRKSQDLCQAHGEDQAGGGAEAAQGGDGAGAGVEPGADAVGDTDAADQQRSQADKRHEQAGLVDEAGHSGRGVVRIADTPALIWKSRLQRGLDIGRTGNGGAECVAHHGTWNDRGRCWAANRWRSATRGPSRSGAATRSGSDSRTPRTVKVALPRRTGSPG